MTQVEGACCCCWTRRPLAAGTGRAGQAARLHRGPAFTFCPVRPCSSSECSVTPLKVGAGCYPHVPRSKPAAASSERAVAAAAAAAATAALPPLPGW